MAGDLPAFSFCHPPEQPRKKSQNLNFSDGYPEVRDPEVRHKQRIALAESLKDYYDADHEAVDEDGNPTRSAADELPAPKWLKYDRQVLRFYCYFKESVDERREENFRVRKCTIYFYLEDGTLHISEPRQMNSGIVQGTFLKRHKVPKAGGGYITVSDFSLGEDITIYDRTFRICTCDTFSRRYLLKHGFNIGREEDFPGEPLSTYKESLKKHPLRTHKDFPNKQFLENDGKVLRFFAVWDDRESVYGDRRPYVLHYFLADDTIEILEINERNSGRHSFPMLLRRCQLPREIPSDLLGKNMGSDAFPKSAFYKETDLHVGSYIRVYNRDMLLHDCDEFTRNFYKSKYKIPDDMLEHVDVQEPAPVLARMEMPPHNGFGSEEDSKQNCISLIPKTPYKDFNKILGLDGKVLCFSARFAEDENHKVVPQDVGRLFVFQYYLADDTISIYEPPCRNSGIQGGKFLSREPAPPKWHGKGPYKPQDMFVGARIHVHDRIFELLRADEWTLNWMEDHKEQYPMSDYTLVKTKLEKQLKELPNSENECQTLRSGLSSADFTLKTASLSSTDKIFDLLRKAGVDMTLHELVTIERHLYRALAGAKDSKTSTLLQEMLLRLLH
ncbi:hypothetical protein GOP47_0022028 [Adiantum capillus-veneris]|uniref:DM10 domain-containing protein n=1 Tax=Adiantum capillus-veneris TaxID=13818 RepID=A0A9D4UAL6_ADICA|nr:hypothetical protein GOP47_0022028 [Adiantum capillus-veneris]